jgi:hypothetical protein
MSSESGYLNLVGAMFRRLRLDLRGETGESDRQQRVLTVGDAIAFLDDPQFETWCVLCGAHVEAVRESMMAEIPERWQRYVGHPGQDG